MRRKIFVSYGMSGRLAREFDVTRATVARSLAFENDTYLGKEIRRRAMELGGTVVELGAGGVGLPAEDVEE